MSKHTPGPWTVWKGHFGVFAGVTTNEHSHIVADTDICELPDPDEWDGGSTAQLSANARLIAAAPELLEALKRLEAVAGKISALRAGQELVYALMDAKSAIAKAEGTTTKEKK